MLVLWVFGRAKKKGNLDGVLIDVEFKKKMRLGWTLDSLRLILYGCAM